MELILKKYVSFILLSLHVWYKMNKIKNVTEISPNLTDFHIYACNNKISVRICNYSKLIKYRLAQKLQDWQYQLFLFRNIRAYIRPTTTDFAELILIYLEFQRISKLKCSFMSIHCTRTLNMNLLNSQLICWFSIAEVLNGVYTYDTNLLNITLKI